MNIIITISYLRNNNIKNTNLYFSWLFSSGTVHINQIIHFWFDLIYLIHIAYYGFSIILGLHSKGFNSWVITWNIGVRKILGSPYTQPRTLGCWDL